MNKMTLTHRFTKGLHLFVIAVLLAVVLGILPVLVAHAAKANLTVTKLGTGTGTVTSNPVGIDCGTDCTEYYKIGTEVTLTATPDAGSVFAAWSGDCVQLKLDRSVAGRDPTWPVITFTMNETNMNCTANFGLPVGGIVVPVNRLGLVAPWMGLVAPAGLAALGVVLVRRRRG